MKKSEYLKIKKAYNLLEKANNNIQMAQYILEECESNKKINFEKLTNDIAYVWFDIDCCIQPYLYRYAGRYSENNYRTFIEK